MWSANTYEHRLCVHLTRLNLVSLNSISCAFPFRWAISKIAGTVASLPAHLVRAEQPRGFQELPLLWVLTKIHRPPSQVSWPSRCKAPVSARNMYHRDLRQQELKGVLVCPHRLQLELLGFQSVWFAPSLLPSFIPNLRLQYLT